MIKKRKVTPAAAGGQLPASDISTEGPAQHLSALNNLFVWETVDQLNAIAAELRQKIAIMDAKQDTYAERTGNPVKNAELRTAEVNQVKMSPLIACRKKDAMNRDLERAVVVKDLSRSDLDEKMIELTYLKERLRSLLHAFAQELSSIAAVIERTKLEEEERRREELSQSVTHDMERCLEENSNLVVKLVRNMEEMMCRKKKEIKFLNAENKAFASKISTLEEKGKKREELLQSVTHDMVLTKTCLEEKGDLVLKLVREVEEVKSRKEKELELLIAENKTLASKISMKEIGDRLRDEVLDDPWNENSTLVAGSEEIEERDAIEEKGLESALIDELVELKMQRSRLLANLDISCGMGAFTQLEIDELKSKMTRKNMAGKKRAKYEIKMSNLVGELVKHKSSERTMGDAYRSCNEKCDIKAAEIASMQRELKMKADEAVDLRLQLKELVRDMEEMKCLKEKEVELLNAENKTLASKIFALEEGLGDRLRDEVLDDPRKENSTLGAGSEEIKKRDVMEEKDLESALIDELVELKMQRSRLLANLDIACGMGAFTQLEIDELKSKMTRKNMVGKKRAKYEIQMSNLVGELVKHKSKERTMGDAYSSCNEKCDIKAAEIASMQRELKMKADEAVDLRLQLKELVRDMEEMKCRKEKEVELLNVENKTLASKIFALEEGLGDRLRDEVLDDPKKENSTLGAGSEEIKKRDVMAEKDLGSALIDELVELEMQRSQLLAKHDISHHMGEITIGQMDELERKMLMKNSGGKRRAEYNIQMVNLLGVLDNHKSAEIRILADYRSCKVKCDIKAAEISSMQRELKMKADEAVDLRLQLKELMKNKQNFELMCNHLQLDLNGLTRESVKMRTLIDYLTAEKASLEKHLETSQEELKDVQRTLMASVNASCSVISKLKKTAAEAVGHEGAQDNCIRGHRPGEILVIHGRVGGDAKRPSFHTPT